MIRKNGTSKVYRIVVRSELSDRYASAFEGMQMEAKKWADDPDRRDQRPAAPIRHPRPPERLGIGAPKRAGPLRRRSPKRRGDQELKPLTGTRTISPARLMHRSAWKGDSQKLISTIVHRSGLFGGCWNWSRPPGATVHYLPALASEVSQKSTFPIGSAKALRHTQSNHLPGQKCLPCQKRKERCLFLGPSEAAQHFPEGIRPDLHDPGERVVELAYGEEYGADE
jgi:hypothetical protein